MSALRFVLGDQLTRSLSSLADLDRERDVVLMAEVADEAGYVPHHRQKLVLVFSAMRHFAAELREEGVRVDYVELDDDANTGSFPGELRRAVERHRPERVILTAPGEWRVERMALRWQDELGVEVEIREDDRFLCSRAGFARWAGGQSELRLERFYREMRRRSGWLMQDGRPVGGRWNYDRDNRRRLPEDESVPPVPRFVPDPVTRAVLDLVERRFPERFGDLAGFGWPVTRADALVALDRFVAERLPRFGDYQDAMRAGDPFLFHSLLSTSLNLGLLLPREVCEAAVAAWERGDAPLNAVEGFVRQILGWREYVRGLYWLSMPAWAESNHLDARRPLPGFYWSGETPMRCVRETVATTRRHAYAHHIQRLMVTGNFALLAGIDPREVERWYLAVYADAFEWVELPNTHGMALYADGGVLASKPYAASGAYIDRMSDYCRGCAFDPQKKLGEGACPFNVLYWDFLDRNRERLAGNHRLAMPYRTLDRMPEERRERIRHEARAFLDGLDGGN